MVAQERCLEEELGSIPGREQDLATRSKELEEHRALLQRWEAEPQEKERSLKAKETDIVSREAVLEEHAQDLSRREEIICWEATADSMANERVAAAQRDAREVASAAALDAAAKTKDAHATFES